MSDVSTAVLLSLLPLFAFGISNVMQKRYISQYGSARLIVYRNVTVVAILAIMLLIASLAGLEKPRFTLEGIVYSIFISSLSYWGLYFVNRGFEYGNAGIIIPISKGSVLISSIVGVLFLNDKLSLIQSLLILAIFIGIVAGSVNFKKLRESDVFKMTSGIPFAVLAAMFWGLTMPFFSVGTERVGTLFFTLILETIVLTLSVLILISRKQKLFVQREVFRSTWRGVFLMGLTGVLGTLGTNAAYNTGEIGITSAVTGAAPIVSAFFAYFLLKERLHRQQIIALITITLAIVLLPLV